MLKSFFIVALLLTFGKAVADEVGQGVATTTISDETPDVIAVEMMGENAAVFYKNLTSVEQLKGSAGNNYFEYLKHGKNVVCSKTKVIVNNTRTEESFNCSFFMGTDGKSIDNPHSN